MNMNNRQKVITYIPKESQEVEEPASDMGTIRRGLWMYTHKLGLNFSLVLLLALAYQAFVAVFIALNGMKTIPIFANLSPTDNTQQIIGNTAAIIMAAIIQGLIIAEMAQVVWLRHPDRLKVRLMSGSIWWWVMLFALIVSIGIDFLLLFLSITSKPNFQEAWQAVQKNQMTGLTILLLSILNFLTLLRCASVMRTSTSDEIRREVEERLNAIAEEILIDAGDSARAKAAQVWKKLSVNPQRFVPIHDSVLNLISQNHPNIIPPQLGGDTWAYDFTGNTFAVLPPDVHQALLQNRYRVAHESRTPFEGDDNQLLWRLPPVDMAEMIAFNVETYGKPRFVDITEPETPKFLTRPVEFGALGLAPTGTTQAQNAVIQNTATTQQMPLNMAMQNTMTQPFTVIDQNTSSGQYALPPASNFISTLTPTEKALFGSYLTHTVFPHVHEGQKFPQGVPDLSIFEVFDNVELQWYYRYWKKHASVRH
ncbi:MAG TPA: hypothetical protein VH186_21480 [Chloroflexia bacterium]|nr:hypothetical protein [Chloroflexia bacterium]